MSASTIVKLPTPPSSPKAKALSRDSGDERKDDVVASSLNMANDPSDSSAPSSSAAAATSTGYSLFGAFSYLTRPVAYLFSSSSTAASKETKESRPKITAENLGSRIESARSRADLEIIVAEATSAGLYNTLIETVFTFILNERIKIITPEKMAAEKGDLDKFAQRLSGQLKITDADIERSELCRNIQILWQDKSSLRRTVVNALALFCIKMEGRIEFDTDTQKLDQDIFFGWCKKMGLTSKTLDLIKGASAYFSDIHFIEDEVYLGNSNTKYSDGIKDLIPIKVAKKVACRN